MLDSTVRAPVPEKHAFILTHRPTTTERMSRADRLALPLGPCQSCSRKNLLDPSMNSRTNLISRIVGVESWALNLTFELIRANTLGPFIQRIRS